MTLNPYSPPGSDYPPPTQGPQRSRRWWLIGGLVVALALVGAAAAYAGTMLANRGEPAAEDLAEPTIAPSSSLPSMLPDLPPPSGLPKTGFAFCREVFSILGDMVDVDVDFVETRRTAADRLRDLTAPTPTHQAAIDALADELDAAAQMVEEDPTTEREARDRGWAASDAFINSGGCD